MKSQMIVALEALETLLSEGHSPKRSIYFCFGHDEELRGTEGAARIAAYLKEKGVRFEYVLDEGGAVLDGKILGINNKIALIGTCEKGYADIKLEAEKTGGARLHPHEKDIGWHTFRSHLPHRERPEKDYLDASRKADDKDPRPAHVLCL